MIFPIYTHLLSFSGDRCSRSYRQCRLFRAKTTLHHLLLVEIGTEFHQIDVVITIIIIQPSINDRKGTGNIGNTMIETRFTLNLGKMIFSKNRIYENLNRRFAIGFQKIILSFLLCDY